MRAWVSAFRLRTLPLALSCIGMGGFLAAAEGKFNGLIFFLCCLTTIFLQILSNLANDYGDSVNGADHAERKGPARAVQSGLIPLARMKQAIILFSLLSFFTGVILLFVSFGFDWSSVIVFLGLGLLCIAAAVAYTVGRKPYGYEGLGDLAVLIFFGLVGVLGSDFLFTHEVTVWKIFPALSCGFFSVAVLNVNNIRDIDSDKMAGKFSVPVRIGKANAVVYHWFLLVSGLTAAAIYTVLHYQSPFQFLFLLAAPLLVHNGWAVAKKTSGELDPFLKQMALSTLAFVILFGTGQLIA
jgi:1,4-dihydroxy-2-naphthoate polyprenyltransferase